MNSTLKYLSSTFLIAFSMVSFSIKANSEPIKLDNKIASASNTSKPIFSTSYTRKSIKIGLSTESSTIPVSSSVNGSIFLLKDGELTKILDINPKQYCAISNKNGLLEIYTKEKTTLIPKGKVIVRSNEKKDGYSPLVFGGEKWYRGELEIFPSVKNNKYLTLVNTLPLEEYLYGVVPSEMPSGWPLEALKTQAVAARTYALSNMNQYGELGFDLLPTTSSQVYGGVEEETPVGNQAVDETYGKVVTYNSKLISAYYSSSAGGLTESGLDAWGREIPYLQPVKDYDQDSPRYIWYKTFSNDYIQNVLKKEFGKDLGKILKFSTLSTTNSGRVKTLKIEGTNGEFSIDAKKFRLASKLNSTLFKVEPVDVGTTIDENKTIIPNLFLFTGKGFGHGSGMSQWGARGLAKIGKSYEEILKYYYSGVEISEYK